MSELFELTTGRNGITRLTLNRPEVHNAFNAALIADLSETLDRLAEAPPRVLLLAGVGKSFSAGADLAWMRAMAEANEDDNRDDALALGAMFRKLDELPCPTVARVHGAAFGGGVGLIACCDIAVASESARFGLTEVRLGLIPATIAPFVIARIGAGQARRYMLTGERFDAERAERIGLVHERCDPDRLDSCIDELVSALASSGPTAVAECKRLVRAVAGHVDGAEALDRKTADWIARIRVGSEGQEGLRAFLEKRRPGWVDDPRT